MGSKEIWNIQYGESFAFIGIIGNKNYNSLVNEKRSHNELITIQQIFKKGQELYKVGKFKKQP